MSGIILSHDARNRPLWEPVGLFPLPLTPVDDQPQEGVSYVQKIKLAFLPLLLLVGAMMGVPTARASAPMAKVMLP